MVADLISLLETVRIGWKRLLRDWKKNWEYIHEPIYPHSLDRTAIHLLKGNRGGFRTEYIGIQEVINGSAVLESGQYEVMYTYMYIQLMVNLMVLLRRIHAPSTD